ncbi:Mg2+ and Co2+ transporter [Acidiphilium acidophilum DSM 700]|uniref:Magnesium transport protein CorA n=2 Tax=Acidiphilium acidophilum TaxID=76588 RepID=A0AAW9DT81_ACIAO|nr:magnesium transporter CorA family protein [Acidiphilium acidophilum]GBQ12694.1 Mg2+ and Co2+ transporter [Acidiphilium acidophilum DSM 700]
MNSGLPTQCMIRSIVRGDAGVSRLDDEAARARLGEAVWIDLVNPADADVALVTAATGLAVPNEADLMEIETSSRLSVTTPPGGAVLTMSMPMMYSGNDGVMPAPLGIVLAPDRLVTIRFAPSRAFQGFWERLDATAEPASADILVGLLEALIDRQADALEQARGQIDRLSHRIFHLKLSPDGRHAGATRRQQEGELRETVSTLGQLYNTVSLVRDSQLGIGRIVPYMGSVATWVPETMTARLKTVTQDVASLNEFITHLTDKIQFVLDATLGLINIAQSDLMKVLTIVSVIGIPPTLIAGIYGMNFVHMPELHWRFGYPYGLGLILITAVAPLFWFRKKGWL